MQSILTHVGTTDDVRSEADTFSHGYLAVTDPRCLPQISRSWPHATLGPLTVALHPKATAHAVRIRRRRNRDAIVVIVGHPVSLELGTVDIRRIARSMARTLQRHGRDACIRKIAYLSGRFNAILAEGNNVTAIPDPCASQSMYWSTTSDAHFALATHAALVAQAVGADVDEGAIARVERLKSIRRGMTRFFAGIDTPYSGVRPVLANSRIEWDGETRSASHRRFYPFDIELAPTTVDDAYVQFRELFLENCRLLASFGRTAVSLTAGLDSQTTFRGVLPHLGGADFTFSYYNPKDTSQAHANDVFEANRTSMAAGIPHRIIRWRRPEPGSTFDRVFSRTWNAYRPSDGAACAMYEDLPRGIFQLQSMHAEVGTGFYRRRTSEPPSAGRLTTLYQGPQAARHQDYVERFEEFIAYADFVPERLAPFDYHDMFYWEHRDSVWAAQKPHEGDLGHRVLQPFNCRQLIELMHSLPYAHRQDKTLFTRFHEGPLPASAGSSGRRPRLSRLVSDGLDRNR